MLDILTIKQWLLVYALCGFTLIGVNIYIALKLSGMGSRLMIESDLVRYLKEQRGPNM